MLFDPPTKAALVAAIDIKVASLTRAAKGAQPHFKALYEADIATYNRLRDQVLKEPEHAPSTSRSR